MKGVQYNYKCLGCGNQFQNKRRPSKSDQKVWKDHVWKRQTVKDLTETYRKSEKTIRHIIDRAETRPSVPIPPRQVVCVFDATHLGDDVLLAAREPNLKVNLGWAWIPSETKEGYAALKANLESRGFQLKAVILDGRTGIPTVFRGIPVQICQFHQLQTIKRKLTLRPETEAGQTLLAIGFSISKSDEQTLTHELDEWFKKYGAFINEKTYPLGTKHWRYTHRRVRSAYNSLRKNLPFLFTYQKYPDLNISNTTNSLDGYWSRLKNLLGAHRGKSKERIRKIATEILRKQTA